MGYILTLPMSVRASIIDIYIYLKGDPERAIESITTPVR